MYDENRTNGRFEFVHVLRILCILNFLTKQITLVGVN